MVSKIKDESRVLGYKVARCPPKPPTCGHVKEEGENTAAVITSPEQAAWCIKG